MCEREREREGKREDRERDCGSNYELCVDGVDADLKEGVTDFGLRALASSGCGAQLTSLSLGGELLFVLMFLEEV